MNLNRHPNPVVRQLYAEVMALNEERKRLLRTKYAFKFDASQPRVPAGSPDGGQWVGNNSGGGQNGTGGDPQLERVRGPATPARPPFMRPGTSPGQQPSPAAPYLRPPQGPQPDTPSRPPYLQPTLPQDPQTPRSITDLQRTLLEYNELSKRNGPNSQAVLFFRAREHALTGFGGPIAETRVLTRDEVIRTCPRFEEVQSIIDNARATVLEQEQRRNLPFTPQTYGTALHLEVKRRIDAMRDEDLVAERSASATGEHADNGELGSYRGDIFERAGNNTTCAYDIKTGQAIFGPSRMLEIGNTARRIFPETLFVLTIQKRG